MSDTKPPTRERIEAVKTGNCLSFDESLALLARAEAAEKEAARVTEAATVSFEVAESERKELETQLDAANAAIAGHASIAVDAWHQVDDCREALRLAAADNERLTRERNKLGEACDVFRARILEVEADAEALAGALREFYPCGRISNDRLRCQRSPGHSGHHETDDGARVCWPESEAVGWEPLYGALANHKTGAALEAERERVRAEGRKEARAAVYRTMGIPEAQDFKVALAEHDAKLKKQWDDEFRAAWDAEHGEHS